MAEWAKAKTRFLCLVISYVLLSYAIVGSELVAFFEFAAYITSVGVEWVIGLYYLWFEHALGNRMDFTPWHTWLVFIPLMDALPKIYATLVAKSFVRVLFARVLPQKHAFQAVYNAPDDDANVKREYTAQKQTQTATAGYFFLDRLWVYLRRLGIIVSYVLASYAIMISPTRVFFEWLASITSVGVKRLADVAAVWVERSLGGRVDVLAWDTSAILVSLMDALPQIYATLACSSAVKLLFYLLLEAGYRRREGGRLVPTRRRTQLGVVLLYFYLLVPLLIGLLLYLKRGGG